MKVQFTDLQEFQEELHADRDKILRSILRVTRVYQPVQGTSATRYVSVVAGAVVRTFLIELRIYCGKAWGKDHPESQQSADCANGIIGEIETWAKDRGLEVRAGIFSANGEDWK